MKTQEKWNLFGIKTYRALAIFTYAVILSTLFTGNPLRNVLPSQDLHAVLFLTGMILIGSSCILNLRNLPSWRGRAVYLGIAAILLLFFLRLSLNERSHLIEYCILTVFVFNAFDKKGWGKYKRYRSTFGVCFGLGVLDELLQYFLPNRVLDGEDIVFNTLAISIVLFNHFISQWAKKWIKKKPS